MYIVRLIWFIDLIRFSDPCRWTTTTTLSADLNRCLQDFVKIMKGIVYIKKRLLKTCFRKCLLTVRARKNPLLYVFMLIDDSVRDRVYWSNMFLCTVLLVWIMCEFGMTQNFTNRIDFITPYACPQRCSSPECSCPERELEGTFM